MKSIYVGNLSLLTTEAALRAKFDVHGEIRSLKIITDRETGRSRGFAFIEMAGDQETEEAIKALNGVDLDGNILSISEARPRGVNSPNGQGARRSNR